MSKSLAEITDPDRPDARKFKDSGSKPGFKPPISFADIEKKREQLKSPRTFGYNFELMMMGAWISRESWGVKKITFNSQTGMIEDQNGRSWMANQVDLIATDWYSIIPRI